MRVWIDLSNSPHPLLFSPIVRRLRNDGHEVLLTARDNAQTAELALERWPETEVIGGRSPKQKVAKLRQIARRTADLRRWARAVGPDVALSHNSYAQIVAASSLGVRAVTAMDFEHQPANHLAFRLASTVVLPEVLPLETLRRQGAAARKTVRYPGLKEELYIGDFEPDPSILARLPRDDRRGKPDGGRQTVVVARTPPTSALYHQFANPLFELSLQMVCSQEHVVCVVLARNQEQIGRIEALQLRNCIVPHVAVDSRSLMYAADVMIGAGGTMTREAALIGIPTWTLYAGTPPAVDLWLERRGKLVRLTAPEQLARLAPRPEPPSDTAELRARGREIEEVLVRATLKVAARRSWHRPTPVATLTGTSRSAPRRTTRERHPLPGAAEATRPAVIRAARLVEQWGRDREWRGPDPYDGLNATRIPSELRRTPTARRIVTQVVKRSPVDLRGPLGIPPGASAAALAWVASTYARDDGTISDEPVTRLDEALESLLRLRCAGFSEPCWGYHFDVQTRVFFYSRATPNAIATAFAGHALLDAHARLSQGRWLELASDTAEFLLARFPATPTREGAFFGYLVGDRTPIHNSNLLICSFLARLAHETGNATFAESAAEGVAYALAHQRPDGSWPYGERAELAWVDNFHTGYVLEALMRCRDVEIGGARLDAAVEHGLRFYRRELFREDGAPKYQPDSLYPIDSQCVAQGIQTFALAARLDRGYGSFAWRVARFALDRMRRRDGVFMFQQRRLWSNPTPHVRWCQASMLLAFAHLLELPMLNDGAGDSARRLREAHPA